MNYNNVSFEMAVGTASQLIPGDLPEVCFSGRSNVGKSSLLNRVLGRKALARVSGRPGKTATINFYRLEGLRLADLPGYGFARVAKSEKLRWGELMEAYFSGDRPIALVIQLIDMRHSPSEDDLSMLRLLCSEGLPFAVALTKSDKLNVSERTARMKALETELDFLPQGTPVIPFSATKGEGAEEIRALLEAAANTAK